MMLSGGRPVLPASISYGKPQDRYGGSYRPRFRMSRLNDFNPFYNNPAKKNLDPRAEEMRKRWDEFFSALEKKAKAAG